MALNNTIKQMRELLQNLATDLEKAAGGNKAASQRVRTGSIRFEKVAKLYRKESIASEKRSTGRKKKTATKKAAKKTTARKTASKKTTKRSTAKLPARRRSRARR